MNSISRIATGLIFICIGIGLLVGSFFILSLLIYGIVILIFGFIVFLNKEEDKIEERKDIIRRNH